MTRERFKAAISEYSGGAQWRQQGWRENLWVGLVVGGLIVTINGVLKAVDGDAWAALFGIGTGLSLLGSGIVRSSRSRRRRSETG